MGHNNGQISCLKEVEFSIEKGQESKSIYRSVADHYGILIELNWIVLDKKAEFNIKRSNQYIRRIRLWHLINQPR